MKFTVHGSTKKYRNEQTFRYLIVGIVYFSVFQIPTSVSVSVFYISDIGSVFSVYRPITSRTYNGTMAYRNLSLC